MSQLRIVVAYPDGELSSALFRAVQRARRTVARAGYAARLDLLPASQVPADAAPIITANPDQFPAEFDALVARLTASSQLQRGPEPPRTIAVHRGFRALTDRARIAE